MLLEGGVAAGALAGGASAGALGAAGAAAGPIGLALGYALSPTVRKYINGSVKGTFDFAKNTTNEMLNGQVEENNPFKIKLPRFQQQEQSNQNPFFPMDMPNNQQTQIPLRDFPQIPLPYRPTQPLDPRPFKRFPQMEALGMGFKSVNGLPAAMKQMPY